MRFFHWLRGNKVRGNKVAARPDLSRQARPRRRLQLEPLEDRFVPASFSVADSALQINLATNETVGVTTTGTNYQFALASGTWSGVNGGGATGSGTATLTATAAAFVSVRIDDAGTGNKVNFNNSGGNTYASDFAVLLDNASAGITFTSGGQTHFGTHNLVAITDRNITFTSLSGGATLDATDGDITLIANQQGVPTSGSFIGIDVPSATVRVTGAGNLTLAGRGGDGGGGSQFGVHVRGGAVVQGGPTGTVTVEGTGGPSSGSLNYGVHVQGSGGPPGTITSGGGPVFVTGQGGGMGSSGGNYGVIVQNFGVITANGMGAVTVQGTGGAAFGNANRGVFLTSSGVITTGGGNLLVTGQAGGLGSSSSNHGVEINGAACQVAAGGGSVTVQGTGGGAAGSTNIGVNVNGGTITSGAGSVQVTGTGGGGSGPLDNNWGVVLQNGGQVTSGGAGAVAVHGTGGAATGAQNYGVYINSSASRILSGGGNVSVTGQGGTGGSPSNYGIYLQAGFVATPTNGGALTLSGDAMKIDATTIVTASSGNPVTLRPRNAGVAVNLGSTVDTTPGTLELSAAELARVTGATLQIGDAASGPITVSAPIVRTSATVVNLTSGGAITFTTGSLITGGANAMLTPGVAASVGVAAPGTDVNVGGTGTGTLAFANNSRLAIAINGLIADTQYQQLNVVGQVNLTGVILALSGSYVPGTNDSFTIVNNDGGDAVTGTFNGLPEGARVVVNGVDRKITYLGGTGNDVVIAPNAAPAITSNGGGASAAVAVPENTTAVTTVTVTDPDAGQSLAFHIAGGADAARFTIDATTGVLAFFDAPDFEHPTDSGVNNVYDVIVRVNDPINGVDTQAIAVTVTPVNEAPVAVVNSYGTNGGVPLTRTAPGVLANDFDPDSDPLTAALVAGPAHGTITLNADGSFTYTPAGTFSGTDTFTYQASDGLLASNVATVTIVVTTPYDYGDAPASYDEGLLGPAQHLLGGGLYLGAAVDGEAGPQSSADASGDGADEDGVTFGTPLVRTTTATVTVQASQAGVLDGWVDFYHPDPFLPRSFDANERVFTHVPVQAGPNVLTFAVPAGATAGATFARFRLSATGVSSPTWPAADGEVEDYQVSILAGYDYGDAPASYATAGPGAARHRGGSGLYLGGAPDEEADGQPSADASGDGPDEDGVTLPPASAGPLASTFTSGITAQIGVSASASGFVDAFLDVNRDGDFADAGEHVLTSAAVGAGASILSFTVPQPAGPAYGGLSYLRVRLSGTGGLAFDGTAEDGEVEDYRVAVNPLLDYGDAPASYESDYLAFVPAPARHLLSSGLFLGAAVDAEGAAQSSADASGDGADEDGVTFATALMPGTTATVTVYAAQAGSLDAWIDFNRDGVFRPALPGSPSGEQIITARQLQPGANVLTFAVPASATPGAAFARFRLSSVGGLLPTRLAEDGEVEDYVVTLVRNPAFNNAPTAADDSYTVPGATTLAVSAPGVLANDGDADGDPLSALLVSGPAHGTLTFNASGAFTYTPTGNYSGPDAFTYLAADGIAASNVATVSLTVLVPSDYGDLPHYYDDGTFNLPASHALVSGLFLGASADGEAGPQSGTSATGDGADEDGVTFGPLVRGATATVTVTASQAGVLDAWLDADRIPTLPSPFGSGDRIFNHRAVTAGVNVLTFTVPSGATLGTTYARFRLSSQGVAFPVNPAPDGEVEDYQVSILAGYDYGDAPASYATAGPGAARHRGGSGLYLGGAPDEEADGQPSADASGDGADEDGVAFAAPPPGVPVSAFTSGADGSVTVSATGAGRLDVFLDVNRDGDFADAGEKVVDVRAVAVGDNVVTFTVPAAPAGAFGGLTYMRFRLSSAGGLAFDGAAEDGEVEDYRVAINPALDYGDAPASYDIELTVSAPARHLLSSGLYLGMGVDAEGAAANSNDAAGDDGTGTDDEDGVTFNTPLVKGRAATGTVVAAQAGWLDAWIDYDHDGMFDPNSSSAGVTEPIFINVPLAAGANVLTFSVPAFALRGATFARFRVSAAGGLSPTRFAPDGEVEDYRVTIDSVPVAVGNAYTTPEDAALVVAAPGVLANDTDADGDPLTAILVTGPAHGSLTLNPDGSFTYTPAANYNGPDGFTYKASDGVADSNVATVTLTVTPTNDVPVAQGDSYTTDEDTPLVVAAPGLLANDADLDGDGLTAVLVSGPTHGTLSLNAGGAFTYTPAANYYGQDAFTYKASDGTLSSTAVTVALTVNPVNDAPPVAVNDAYTTSEDVTLTVAAPGVLANDSDVDNDPLTAELVSPPTHGTLTLHADGSFSYKANANYNGPDSFTYKVKDGASASNVATVNLTVTPVNDPPVAVADAYVTLANQPLTVNAPGVLANDTDREGSPLAALGPYSGPSHGTLLLLGNGRFTYTPQTNFHGTDSFTYRANDGTSSSVNVATVTITVDAVPVAGNDALATVEDTPLVIAPAKLLANDSDADGNPLTVVVAQPPAHGTLTTQADGTLRYQPAADFHGKDSFTYKANDGIADSNAATVTITVHSVPQGIDPAAAEQVLFAADETRLTVALAAVSVQADPTAPRGRLFRFALDPQSFTNQAAFQLTPTSGARDAALALYDADGNLLAVADADATANAPGVETLLAVVKPQRFYHLGIYPNPSGPAESYRLTVQPGPQTVNPTLTPDGKGNASLDANQGEDTFNHPADVDYYPLDLLNGGATGTVTVTASAPGMSLFATLFRRQDDRQPWLPLESRSDTGAVTLQPEPLADSSLTDAEYLLAVATRGFTGVARSYKIDVTVPLLGPATLSSNQIPLATNLLTPAPISLGVAEAVASGQLTPGQQRLYRFRAPEHGTATVTLEAAFDPLVSVYDVTGQALLGVASQTRPHSVRVSDLAAGAEYLVRVADVGGNEGGSFTLTVHSTYQAELLPFGSDNGGLLATNSAVQVGPAQGAKVFQVNPASGTDVLVVSVTNGAGADPVAVKVVVVGGQLEPVTYQVAAGQPLFLPVVVSGKPGPFDLFVEGLSGSNPVQLRVGQLQVPDELPASDLARKGTDLAGDLQQTASAPGQFGAFTGLQYYQLLTEPGQTTTFTAQGTGGARPLLANYQEGGDVLRLVSFTVPDTGGIAQTTLTLPGDRLRAVAAFTLTVDGVNAGRGVTLNVDGPAPVPVGVAMVPHLEYTGTGFQSLLSIRNIVLKQDFAQDLWKTILPYNLVQANGTEELPTINFIPSPGLRAKVSVFQMDAAGGYTLLKQGTNAQPGSLLKLQLGGDTATINSLKGRTLAFRVEAMAGQLGEGTYTLEMTVQTTDPYPYLIDRKAYWRFPGPKPAITNVEGTAVADTDGQNVVVGDIPAGTPVVDILQNQYGDGRAEGAFVPNRSSGQVDSLHVYRFWVASPGPLLVRTVADPQAGEDLPVNTTLRVYAARYDAAGRLYLGQLDKMEVAYTVDGTGVHPNNNVGNVIASTDWFPADRSTIDAQTYVNDFGYLRYTEPGGQNPYLTGGVYYVVVKNEEGSQGHYHILVDAPNFPALGGTSPSGTPISRYADDPLVASQVTAVNNQVTYIPPATGGDVPLRLDYLADFRDFVGYFPVGSSRVDLQACKLEYSIVSPK